MRDRRYRATVILAALLAATVSDSRADSPAIVTSEFIYETAPFPSCHASTIAETNDGTLVAAWFGGTAEKHKDVGIWVSRREGDRWTPPVEVANGVQYRMPKGEEHRHPCWNPVLFQPPDSPLLLFYKCGPSPDAWWGMVTRSSDGGKTWSFPRRLPEGILGPVKNKPVVLDGGRMLCPSSSEHDGWRVHFEITPDHGRTWTRVGPINDGKEISAIQPSILKHKNRKLQALGRSEQGRVWTAWSDDNGLNWGPMTLLDLPNPNAGTDAVTLVDGRHLLVYNHTEKGRSPLNVALSENGTDWTMSVVLEDAPGEYSYPAVIQTDDRKVHITYTWKREKIRHVVIDPTKLTE